MTYRAEIRAGRREPLFGRASLGFVSFVSCKTHLAHLCQERPPDGGHRLRQQTSGGDPSFSGGYHRLFPQKEMGVHNPCGPFGAPRFQQKEPGAHIPCGTKRPPLKFNIRRSVWGRRSLQFLHLHKMQRALRTGLSTMCRKACSLYILDFLRLLAQNLEFTHRKDREVKENGE